jgi:DNA-binding NtrC family response regulator
MRTTLITFAGYGDPESHRSGESGPQPGPVLHLTSLRKFERVILLGTPETAAHTAATQAALAARHPQCEVLVLPLDLPDPTSYSAILTNLRKYLRPLIDEYPDDEYFVATASGTPQMHACWLLLCASQELPARILQTRPPRFVTAKFPVVTELDLSDHIFPIVRSTETELTVPADPRPGHHHHPPAAGHHRATAADWRSAAQSVGMVGGHPQFRRVLETAATLAPYDVPILIQGETGTGKELLAHLVHINSHRREKPFIPVNCAALPRELVESILFGHKRGAFTGANRDQMGKFALADGGTLFLDELGELPLDAQAKMLRVMEDGNVEPLGSAQPIRVDVRIVAATNRPLTEAISEGKFREDFFYRFAEVLHLPPLRERRSDIPKLALHILDRLNKNLPEPKRLSQRALDKLYRSDWQGNVRDLMNVIERAAFLTTNSTIQPEDLQVRTIARPTQKIGTPEPHEGFSLEDYLSDTRRALIEKALAMAEGNQSLAARFLGISPQAVHKFIKGKGSN